MMRARNDRKQPATKPVTVDHDVEREEDGARAVRGDFEHPHREGPGISADGARGGVVPDAPQPACERRGQVGAGEMIRKTRANLGLVLDQR